MAIQKKNSAIKPDEILELEQNYGFILEHSQSKFSKGAIRNHSRNSYFTNDSGVVNGIKITNSNLKDVKFVNLFPNLKYLNLTNNLINDISPLTIEINLDHLFLGMNNIKDINPLIYLPNLLTLTIWRNSIYDLSPLSSLVKLRELYCQNTGLKDLSIISNLKYLKRLGASNNKIENIAPLINLKQLEELWLEDNFIEDISPLTEIKKLRVCRLNNNSIKIIPQQIAEKFQWLKESLQYPTRLRNGIFIGENPLQFPPSSVLELGTETTKNYYETADQFGHAPLSEGRIIFIGDGSSGKSSLIEKILYNSFTLGREQTNGIKIEHLHLKHIVDCRDLVFHIWDFGGQEIQHAVHKFFFTEGCLYVLVLDNRKEEEPEYWLQQIESLGGRAPVLVVFNKHDENATETSDRKYLKEKYPNIVGFYNTSCKTDFGIPDLKKDLENSVISLRTVEEQFPNNWLAIKKSIEKSTAGHQHFLTYDSYQEICKLNHTISEKTQKLLLKYFNTIGAVTWFGEDTHLKFLHVLKPEWITQGVYKILTSKKTAKLFGQIHISDFKEMLHPTSQGDYTYDEKHYAYILSMMKKFDLCDAPDDIHLLIPSAFGKVPKVEYSEFKGEDVRIYILQFKDYMPLALIHRFTAKKISEALDDNYWYTGIVIKDRKSNSLAMVHADKEAKRIYVRIKGEAQLGMWEYIWRELDNITSNYAKIPYDELLALDENTENNVNYDDLVSHVKAGKAIYFHPRLRKDFNVGYLLGLFETKEGTLEKVKKGVIEILGREAENNEKIPPYVIQILNNNSPNISTHASNYINIDIDIDIQAINQVGSTIKGEANYLIEELGKSNKVLVETLLKVVQFANDAKEAKNSGDIKEKGWGRKLKSILTTLSKAGKKIKDIDDGGVALKSILYGIKNLATHFHLKDIADFYETIKHLF